MSEKEKKIVEKLKRAIPNMSDFDKGYILGKTEKMAEESVKKQEEEKTDPEPGMSEETRAKFQQVMRNLQGKM